MYTVMFLNQTPSLFLLLFPLVALVGALYPIFPKECGYCARGSKCFPDLGLSTRIVGGFKAKKAGEVPWQALIRYISQ